MVLETPFVWPFSRTIFTSTQYEKGGFFMKGSGKGDPTNRSSPRLWLEGYGHNNMPQEGNDGSSDTLGGFFLLGIHIDVPKKTET